MEKIQMKLRQYDSAMAHHNAVANMGRGLGFLAIPKGAGKSLSFLGIDPVTDACYLWMTIRDIDNLKLEVEWYDYYFQIGLHEPNRQAHRKLLLKQLVESPAVTATLLKELAGKARKADNCEQCETAERLLAKVMVFPPLQDVLTNEENRFRIACELSVKIAKYHGKYADSMAAEILRMQRHPNDPVEHVQEQRRINQNMLVFLQAVAAGLDIKPVKATCLPDEILARHFGITEPLNRKVLSRFSNGLAYHWLRELGNCSAKQQARQCDGTPGNQNGSGEKPCLYCAKEAAIRRGVLSPQSADTVKTDYARGKE